MDPLQPRLVTLFFLTATATLAGCAVTPASSEPESVDDFTCTSCDVERFVDYDGGFVYDSVLGLVFGPVAALEIGSFEDAEAYCASLATESSLPLPVLDWRLPTYEELKDYLPQTPTCFPGSYAGVEGSFSVGTDLVADGDWVGVANACDGYDQEQILSSDVGSHAVVCVADLDMDKACDFDGRPQLPGKVIGPYVCEDGKWVR